MDLFEVSDVGEHHAGLATVFKNGVEVANRTTFEAAMRYAFPDWQPHDYRFTPEAQADNRADF